MPTLLKNSRSYLKKDSYNTDPTKSVYVNDQFGVSFQYPQLFKQKSFPQNKYSLISDYFVTDDYNMETEGVLSGTLNSGTKIEFHIFPLEPKDFVKNRCDLLKQFSNMTCKQTTYNEMISAAIINKQENMKTVFIEYDNYYIEFKYQSVSEIEYQKYLPEFDKVVDSMVVNKPLK